MVGNGLLVAEAVFKYVVTSGELADLELIVPPDTKARSSRRRDPGCPQEICDSSR